MQGFFPSGFRIGVSPLHGYSTSPSATKALNFWQGETPACAVTSKFVRSELLLVGNASVGEAHKFVDRHLRLQSAEDVLPPPVLHEVDALRTFKILC